MAHQNKSELIMSDYRRVYIPGGVYFFTVVTHNRNPILTHQDARVTLRKAWLNVLQEYPFELIALCLLPDHIHCSWKLPESDSNYSLRWQRIKGYFSKHINKNGFNIPMPSKSKIKKRECGVWQRRFWEHTIRDQDDLNNHIDYIHFNPVKHGYVQRPLDWPWSTFHKYLSLGVYEPDWGYMEPESTVGLKSTGE